MSQRIGNIVLVTGIPSRSIAGNEDETRGEPEEAGGQPRMTYCGTSLLYNPLEGPSTLPRTASDLGVSDGTRTRDILDHNQVLYQLSYTHHALASPAPWTMVAGSVTAHRSGIGVVREWAAACASSVLGPGMGTNTVRR
jgi:hypothetical protein